MVRRTHDFDAIVAEVMKVTAYDVGDKPDTYWELAYSLAIERAIYQHEYALLLRLMDDEAPIHPLMMPALADAIRAMTQGGKDGTPRKLVPMEVAAVTMEIRHQRRLGISKEQVVHDLAVQYGVSESTINRAYKDGKKSKPF